MALPIEPLEPVCVSVTVPVAPDRAFHLFTAEIGRWWPLATHSVGRARSRGVVVEPGVGGRLVESIDGAEAAVWGTVVRWEPPHVLAYTWHPGGTPELATDVLLRFTAAADGTLVEVEHVGWERLARSAEIRADYANGWPTVIRGYVVHAGGAVPGLPGLPASPSASSRA